MEQAMHISAEYGMQHAQDVVRFRHEARNAAARGCFFRAMELQHSAALAERRAIHCANFILKASH